MTETTPADPPNCKGEACPWHEDHKAIGLACCLYEADGSVIGRIERVYGAKRPIVRNEP